MSDGVYVCKECRQTVEGNVTSRGQTVEARALRLALGLLLTEAISRTKLASLEEGASPVLRAVFQRTLNRLMKKCEGRVYKKLQNSTTR